MHGELCIWVLKNQLYKHKMGVMQVYKCLPEKAGKINSHSVTWRQKKATGLLATSELPGGGMVTLEQCVLFQAPRFQRKMIAMEWIQRQLPSPWKASTGHLKGRFCSRE